MNPEQSSPRLHKGKIGTALLALSLATASLPQGVAAHNSSSIEPSPFAESSEVNFDPRNYENGAAGPEQTRRLASPLGELAFKNGSLEISAAQIKSYQQKHPQEKAMVMAITYKDVKDGQTTDSQTIWYSSDQPPAKAADFLDFPQTSIYTPAEIPEITTLPADLAHQELAFRMLDDHTIVDKETVTITHKAQKTCADGSRIIAPYKLKKHFMSDICEVDSRFAPYMQGAQPNYRVKTNTDMPKTNDYSWFEGDVTYNAFQLKDKKGYALSQMVLTHEQAHGVFNLRTKDTTQQKLGSAFKPLSNPQNKLAVETLTESTYADALVEAPTHLGHLDDLDEMFASTTAVLRTFPETFINRFRALPPGQQKVVARVVDEVIDTYKSVNPNKAALQKLLPKAVTVAKDMNAVSH